MEPKSKTSTGPNARPRNESIGQTGPGVPDDSSRPVDVDDAVVERVRERLVGEKAPVKRREEEAKRD